MASTIYRTTRSRSSTGPSACTSTERSSRPTARSPTINPATGTDASPMAPLATEREVDAAVDGRGARLRRVAVHARDPARAPDAGRSPTSSRRTRTSSRRSRSSTTASRCGRRRPSTSPLTIELLRYYAGLDDEDRRQGPSESRFPGMFTVAKRRADGRGRPGSSPGTSHCSMRRGSWARRWPAATPSAQAGRRDAADPLRLGEMIKRPAFRRAWSTSSPAGRHRRGHQRAPGHRQGRLHRRPRRAQDHGGGGDDLKRVSLELGGKSPAVVFADADVDEAVRARPGACSSTRARLRGRHAAVRGAAGRRRVGGAGGAGAAHPRGPGFAPKVHIGPIVSEKQLQDGHGLHRRRPAVGATIVSGGERLGGELAAGFSPADGLHAQRQDCQARAGRDLRPGGGRDGL